MKYEGDVNYAANPYGYPPGETRRRRGMLALGASVVGIAAFAGVVLYAYKGQDRTGPDGGPPLLEADATPTKLRPEQPGGMDVPHQDKLVYDRLNQSARDDRPRVEHLLPPPEAPLPRPVVTPQVEPMPDVPPPPAVAPVPPPPAGATTTVPRAPADVIPTLPPPPVQVQAGLPPALPPGGQSSQVAALPIAPPKAPPPAAKAPAPQPAVAAPPKPAPAPVPQPAAAPGALTPPKTAPQPAAPQPAAAQPPKALAAGGSGYRVQLASVRSEAEAASEWKRLQSRHPELGGLSMQVVKADLGEKGVFYRVQGGSADEARARSICEKLKSQNVGCVVVRP